MTAPGTTEGRGGPGMNPRTLEACRTIVAAANERPREEVSDDEARDLFDRIMALRLMETFRAGI